MSKQNPTTDLIIKDSCYLKNEIDIVPDINSSLLVSVKEEIDEFEGNDDYNQLYDTNGVTDNNIKLQIKTEICDNTNEQNSVFLKEDGYPIKNEIDKYPEKFITYQSNDVKTQSFHNKNNSHFNKYNKITLPNFNICAQNIIEIKTENDCIDISEQVNSSPLITVNGSRVKDEIDNVPNIHSFPNGSIKEEITTYLNGNELGHNENVFDKIEQFPFKSGQPKNVQTSINILKSDHEDVKNYNSIKLKSVTKSVKKIKNIKYSCDTCKKTFTQKESLRSHIFNHSSLKPYSCDVCKRAFSKHKYLTIHMFTHTKDKPFKCEICKNSYSRNGCLIKHMITHTDKRYQCDICKKLYLRTSYLSRHKRTHTGERPYKCNICGKTFIRNYCLQMHILTHGDRIKKYNCNICGKYFAQKEHLKNHKYSHTDDERPYKCNICQKTFSCSGYLKLHLFIHSGLKPFECDVCQKTYSLKSSLRYHIKSHFRK